jgi:hypothetical protein
VNLSHLVGHIYHLYISRCTVPWIKKNYLICSRLMLARWGTGRFLHRLNNCGLLKWRHDSPHVQIAWPTSVEAPVNLPAVTKYWRLIIILATALHSPLYSTGWAPSPNATVRHSDIVIPPQTPRIATPLPSNVQNTTCWVFFGGGGWCLSPDRTQYSVFLLRDL